jgi:CRP/FNR family cyclic AMP-dependent transcriptional regulator
MSPHPIEVLRRVPLFSGLSEMDLSGFAPVLRERRFPKGSVIMMQGERGDAVYLLAEGQVKVLLIGEDGREVILSVLGPGSFFGEMALLDDEPRSAHVVAMEDSLLLLLRREDFQARLRSSPDVALGLLRELSQRLRRADDKIGSLALRDVNGRIAHLLLELAEEEGGDRITRKLTHAIIAQMVGASRETVSRTLSSLATSGVLRMSRREIILLDKEPLRRAAQKA